MIEKKLMAIQQELNCPKGNFNSFGKYKYRSCEDILEAVKPLLKINDVVLTLSDEIVNVGDRFYIKATATLKDDKESIETVAYARECLSKKGMDESQLTGSCSSYARKYALNGLFCIDDVKDADTMDNTSSGTAKATKKQVEYLSSLYKGDNLKKLLESNNVNKLEELPMIKASELIEKIRGNK